jgi:YfiR/HmsC-like
VTSDCKVLLRLTAWKEVELNNFRMRIALLAQAWNEITATAVGRSRFGALVLVTAVGVPRATPVWGQTSTPVEYQVKAAFLFNFAKFVEWPTGAFLSETTPISLCVFGQDPFGGALDEIARGEAIHNREIVVRRTNELPSMNSCQLIFVGNKEHKRLSELLNAVRGVSTLVVGETEGDAEAGTVIQFFSEGRQLRFAVNVDAMQRAKLSFSSKLLALAKIVHDGGHPREN